ncbi:MAG: hypothetical protein DRP10_03175 [Candidatus Aenigmatarchaeota archaeon]|nr:MAG: hypothetical protein DRP10_03175 [Candidatus Aenigmarchaeota archaeon]
MLESIYLLFSGITFCLIVISLLLPIFKKQHPILGFISALMCFVLAMVSVNITTVHCEQATNSTGCFQYSYEDPTLTYFWGGFGIIMFLFSVLITFVYSAETLGSGSK